MHSNLIVGTHFARGSCEVISSGRGMHNIIISEETLKTVLVMRWCRAAEHCSVHSQKVIHGFDRELLPFATGTAQYWSKGRHQTPKYNDSITIQLITTYAPTIRTASCCFSPMVSLLYNSNKQILQPHCVIIIHCSTTRTSLDP